MKGYVTNIEKDSLDNSDFRRVLYTGHHAQLVLMSLMPGDNIGEEVHTLDQFIRVEKGSGKAVLNDVHHQLEDGWVVFVPNGTRHNVINTGAVEMKLYTLYAPPEHRDGTVHKTKSDASVDEEHFDGKTTE